uniref:Uncharacterized protein n=1 Tax=viral metagenome TaxID=1070528 RepID=A0A6C0DZH8_9ZZZZ
MVKELQIVAIEAVVVGIFLIVIHYVVKHILRGANDLLILFISGALFHIIFEVSGLNRWYSEEYCKILKA